ncbi:MAG TPA: helix-turn-helix domain-containing protein [Solirubrobacterales bacterium]|nr:helix-turn-helix domain-containing protein [Solirubrobacterales bacterium]
MEREAPVRDVEYLESLSAAVHSGVRYGIEVLAVGEERAGEMPLALIVQARYAARHRIPLETVLRRYLAAEKQLADIVLEEAAGIDPCQLRAAVGAQSAAFERLLAVATEEYGREVRARPASHEARLVERARRLLAGELVDPSILEYDLAVHHLGLLAPAGARPLLRRLAAELDCRSLLLIPSPEELWAWLGTARGPVDPAAVRAWLSSKGEPEQPIGIGEPKRGRDGWRLTHEQARAALWVAREKTTPVVEYTDAALLASFGRDPLLTASLQERYLLPLASGRDGGQMLRATLRSYFQAGRNSTSAAAALGVSRQTVANRLQAVERCLDQPLDRCADALQAALSLEELGRISVPRDSLP